MVKVNNEWSAAVSINMTNQSRPQRIYIGGLDPTRGLTVQLVASRLCAVPNVEVLSINDAPIKGGAAPHATSSIYKEKCNVVDADGDLVDTRQFFFIEARCTGNDDGGDQATSALQLLAKQYNNTKWKGCQLRVEEARPHFLKRLEMERTERTKKNHVCIEDKSDDAENQPQEKSESQELSSAPKQRRRLRIRKRFGEEAFHVDTFPQTININPNDSKSDKVGNADGGWHQFAHLHTRMRSKRTSMRNKLLEKRKEERRSWSRGEKRGANEASTVNGEGLRGLLFLNRGIHIRFCDDVGANDASVDAIEIRNHQKEGLNDGMDTSSVLDASESDYSTSDEDEGACDKKQTYVWSDDEDDGSTSSRSVISTEDDVSAKQDAEVNSFVWSDEESTDETKNKNKGFNVKTNAGMDEFSGGVDFDDNDSGTFESSVANSDQEVHHGFQSDEESARIEDDIRTNLDILSTLFPGEKISSEPLVAAESNVSVPAESGETGNVKKSSTAAFSGLIMQRYDPNKDNVVKSDIHSSDVKTNDDNVKEPAEDDGSRAQVASDDEEEYKPVADDKSESVNESDSNDEQEDTPQKQLHKPDTSSQEVTGKEIYEQDKLENIFKQAREQQKQDGTSASNGFGFSFGSLFESQLDVTADPVVGNLDQVTADGQKDSSNVADSAAIKSNHTTPESNQARHRRVGLQFPSSVLDYYENQFFSLNEGTQIIASLESMRDNKEIQHQWQKEREVLTADWKRKQKGALSRKVKKVRKF